MRDMKMWYNITGVENARNAKYGKPKVQKHALNFQGQICYKITVCSHFNSSLLIGIRPTCNLFTVRCLSLKLKVQVNCVTKIHITDGREFNEAQIGYK